MPQHPTPTRQGQARLSEPALAQQGIPQSVIPTDAPDEEALNEIIQMLRGGQVGAERLMQLLSLLAASTMQQPQGAPGGPPGGAPGPQPGPPQGGGAPQAPQGGGGQPSIRQLLG